MARFNSTLPKTQCAAKRSTLKNAFCLSLNKLCFEGVDSAYPSLACHLTRTFNYTHQLRLIGHNRPKLAINGHNCGHESELSKLADHARNAHPDRRIEPIKKA